MADAELYQHYEVLRREDGSLWELGRGAMGITYKAFDTSLRCPVALKVINNSYLNSEVARQRFLREARAAASLRHQNVASVFHLGTDHESYFYAMEFIDGETIEAYIKRKGLLDPVEALGITLQVSRALAAADKENLVHRDLKPSNLMLVEEDDEKVVKVIDFGLAKSTQRGGESSGTLTVGGGFVGTPHFASPEQLEERDIDIRSDIYSLGATLYYMLAGRPPYAGSVAQIMSQHLYKPIPLAPLGGFPPCVVDLIRRMMEKDPAKRPQSPSDLRREILPCLGRLNANVTGPSSVAAMANKGEQPDSLATLDISTVRPGPEESGTLLGQWYRIISDLGDAPHGRLFLADDLRRTCRVLVHLFSPEFISDTKRYTALEQEIDRLHRAPNPLLCQVYSLEGAAEKRFLIEERVVGPSLLEILRARGFLSPPEAWLLLNLLAPVADHAQSNGLQQVDLTLSGVRLISPRLTDAWTGSDLLRQSLTRWDQLGVKVAAIDFSPSLSDPETWVGSATLTQTASAGEGRPSYLRLLSLLVYELLGGPRNIVELTGRYSPVAGLSERGNVLLRRGLIDDFRSATEMALQLGGEIVARNLDPVTTMPAPASSPSSSPGDSPSGAIPPSQPVPPSDYSGKPPSLTAASRKEARYSVSRLLPVLFLVVGIGLGGYLLYQFFLSVPKVKNEQLASSSPANSPTQASATPSREALASASAAPDRVVTTGSSVEANAAPRREAVASPTVEVRTTPNRVATVEPSAEVSATPTPSREALASPSAEIRTTPNRVATVEPSAEVSATPTPSREALASPSAEIRTTPNRVATVEPSAEVSATPTPSREALASPSAEIRTTPNRVATVEPSAEVGATPTPSREALANPSAEIRTTPNRVTTVEPSAEVSATPTPSREALANPSAEIRTTPNRVTTVEPSAEVSATPTPSREALASPTVEVRTMPNRVATVEPSAEASATPSRKALASPSVEVSAAPDRTMTGERTVEVNTAPDREVLASPSPAAVATARLEPIATPDSRMAGSRSQTPRNSSVDDDYSDKLAAARRLIDGSDWPGALKAYLALIEQYPERPGATGSLENFLADWSTNERNLDSESLTQMRPDLLRAAEDGVLQAMLIIARSSQESDRATALKWYEAAASKGSVEGMKKAGDLLYSNHKKPADDAKALEFFEEAASTGDIEAEYLAGECYFFGKGAAPDIDKAVQFLQQAAARRDTKAMDLLGTCFRKQGKFEEARRSYEEAGKAGYALSFYNLGVLYMNGEGVLRSPKKAEDQFRRSAELSKQNAERGDMISMFYYANWLAQGIGVVKDAKAAAEWFRRSARAGYPPAIDWCKRNGLAP